MKQVAFFCVNYNSYEELLGFAESVNVAAKTAKGIFNVSIFVADNTTSNRQKIELLLDEVNTKVFIYDNIGYFGAISKMMACTDMLKFNYICVSNVDVRVLPDMLVALSQLSSTNHIGWIAPSIYSELEQRDRNPVATHRYLLCKLRLLKLMFRFPLLHKIQYATVYKRKRLKQNAVAGKIYSGHGSFIILTNEYIERCGIIDYPIFLYGEELYLAETCRNKGLNVIYEPNIRIKDNEHFSTKQMSSRFKDRCNYEALTYIINKFYKQEQ